jgi:Fe-S-cluster containining protein
MLELSLTPYDVLRLRKATGLTSKELLEKYIIIEQEPGEPFPRFYLTMVDDGRASCIFVSQEGCTVYDHRPAACRAYPLGRATVRNNADELEEHFVIMKEEHCLGFIELKSQAVANYNREQGMAAYNTFNDAVAVILQHDSIRKGYAPSKKQVELFTLALYDIDTFREMLLADQLEAVGLDQQEKEQLIDDEKLLFFAISWLQQQLY